MIQIPQFKFWHREKNEIYDAPILSTGTFPYARCWVNGKLSDFEIDKENKKSDGILLPVIDDSESIEGEALTIGDVFTLDAKKENLNTDRNPELFEDHNCFVLLPDAKDCGHIDMYCLSGWYADDFYDNNAPVKSSYHVTRLKEDYFLLHRRDQKGQIENIFTHPQGREKLFEIMGVDR